MPRAIANGVELEYERYGNPEHETVLLIQGLGAQLVHWPMALVELLVERGFQVVRFDNRDIGLSQKLSHLPVPNGRRLLFRTMLRLPYRPPYRLDDMAADSVGLLDALEIDAAHIVGASMGGMIAQLVASHYPERALSLTSIMSTTGNPRLPRPTRAAAAALVAPRPDPADHEAVVARGLKLARAIGSPAYPADPEVLRQASLAVAARSYQSEGPGRQLAASLAAGDRRRHLRRLMLPVTVLHGKDDPLIRVACGVDTARNIPGAELRVIPGMGHDFPEALMPEFADAIEAAARRSQAH
ncbi:alpha/beta hydrolase [Parahaliea maris]|uniref:Alpha/beta hydrolase n=1 Tax=Parahaliea maris TaxID=2716870 RepID=A0A5C9A585_9GAMM|nr:alpha/beta hydrolase [Parahaliea maris]TXS95184.1 alpha/beta hydrolase [Parahaliea maris]